MPIYEYHCSKCGEFETMQKMSDKPLTQCPTCRRKVTKLISSTTFHLKGSGWYITDYARKGEGSAKSDTNAKSDKKKSEAASASSETSTSDGGDKPAKSTKSSKTETSTKTEKAAVA